MHMRMHTENRMPLMNALAKRMVVANACKQANAPKECLWLYIMTVMYCTGICFFWGGRHPSESSHILVASSPEVTLQETGISHMSAHQHPA